MAYAAPAICGQAVAHCKPSLSSQIDSHWPSICELVGQSRTFDYRQLLAEDAPYVPHDLGTIGELLNYSRTCALIKIEPAHQVYRSAGYPSEETFIPSRKKNVRKVKHSSDSTSNQTKIAGHVLEITSHRRPAYLTT